MTSYKTSKIFVIGGTGAQGIPVVRGLVKDKKYSCRVLTRSASNPRAKLLESLGNVELVEGTFADEDILRTGLRGCDGAFVNIDGFNTGEKAEIYWTIRIYELAIEEGIKFFVYGNLDYTYKKSGFNPQARVGHYDGKGRVAEWIQQQTKDNKDRMGAAIFTTGPYIEMTISPRTVMTPVIEDGVVTWRMPLGEGAVPHVALDDCEYYVRWLFDNPHRSNGMDLEVAIDHIHYADLAAAFQKVTGHPARYIDTPIDEYWKSGPMAPIANKPAGYNADITDKATMSVIDNFSGFWYSWKHSGQNKGIIRRDYALLDEIFPGRIRTAEEFFRQQDEKGRKEGLGGLYERLEKGDIKPILKIGEDQRRGKL